MPNDDNGWTTESVDYVYEYWDCGYCGAVGVRGDEETCVQCGHPRDADVKFYRREDLEELVEDGPQLERFTEGPDWACAFCETLNRNSDSVCRSCGATKDESTQSYFDVQAKKAAREAERKPAAPPAPQPSGGMGSKLAIGCGTILVLAIALGWWLTREREVAYEVAKAHWQRDVVVERYQRAQRSDWSDQLKGDGIKKLSSTTQVRSHKQAQVGTRQETYTETKRVKTGTKKVCKTAYKSTGSGASRKVKKCRDVPVYEHEKVTKTRTVPRYEQVPVYGEKVTYTSAMFGPLKTETAQGNDNHPFWPELTLGKGHDDRPDREGKKTERYEVELALKSGKGPQRVKIETNAKRFEGVYKLGSTHKLKVSNAGGVDTGADVDKVLSAE